MIHLFDIVRRAQGGAGLETLGRHFGLNLDQTQRAVEALLPAFTLAFRHAAQDPAAFGRLLEGLSSARFVPYFDAVPGAASPPASGLEAVSRLFGSDEAARRVAEQASALTGVATGVLHAMLPTMAAVIMGGVFRSLSADGLADVLRAWSDWLRTLKPADSSAGSAGVGGDPYRAWMTYVTGGMGAAAAARPAAPPAFDPWSAFLGAVAAKSPPPPPKPSPFAHLFEMFETGREAQARYLADLQATLDLAWNPEKKPSRPS